MRVFNLGYDKLMNNRRSVGYGSVYKHYTWSDMERKFASYGVLLANPELYRLKFWNCLGDGKQYFVFEPFQFHSIKMHGTGTMATNYLQGGEK